MPQYQKLSQIGSSPLPPPFRGLHSPGVRKHCQIIFACYFRKSSIDTGMGLVSLACYTQRPPTPHTPPLPPPSPRATTQHVRAVRGSYSGQSRRGSTRHSQAKFKNKKELVFGHPEYHGYNNSIELEFLYCLTFMHLHAG